MLERPFCVLPATWTTCEPNAGTDTQVTDKDNLLGLNLKTT